MSVSMPRSVPARILVACVAIIASPSLWADAPQQVVDQYASACQQMAKSTPIGDSDLRDSPKLTEYCACFGRKFADRAVTQTALLHTKEEVAAAQAEELQMRNTCRSQFGLPAVPPRKPLKN